MPPRDPGYLAGADLETRIKMILPYVLGLAVILAPTLIVNMLGAEASISPLLQILGIWSFLGGGPVSRLN
jgi:hypothetical protein